MDTFLAVALLLLTQFHANECPCIARVVRVPLATNVNELTEAVVVTILTSEILVDGVSTRDDELARTLKSKRELWQTLRPDATFRGVVVLQVDRRIPASIVNGAVQSATRAGYRHISFQVRRAT